ncbi:MAG: nucleotide-binding domain containing protein, partial [Gemmatimonadota bacterium]
GDLAIAAAAAAQLAPLPLLAGSAGLAAHLPRAFRLSPGRAPASRLAPRPGLLLAVAGSGQAHTRQQVGDLLARCPGAGVAVGAADDPGDVAGRLVAGSAAARPVAILSLRPGDPEPDRAIQVMGAAARYLAEAGALAGVIATGGTTAVAILQALDATAVEILEAVGGQVPLCLVLDGPCAGLPLVTKGGALGEIEIFARAARRLAIGARQL